jgi:hypothetical protein
MQVLVKANERNEQNLVEVFAEFCHIGGKIWKTFYNDVASGRRNVEVAENVGVFS